MANEQQQPLGLEFRPLTPECWENFEDLFGEKGACGGCWCMWLRLKRSEYESQKGTGNRRAMEAIVDSGEIPGLLAYDGDKPVGWCAVGPREVYPVEPKKGAYPPAFAWPGIKRVFDKAGFVEVARRSQTRPMMRYVLG